MSGGIQTGQGIRRIDTRAGTGRPSGVVRMPTQKIPCHCMCSWKVVVMAPGPAAISQLHYRNTSCPVHRVAV